MCQCRVRGISPQKVIRLVNPEAAVQGVRLVHTYRHCVAAVPPLMRSAASGYKRDGGGVTPYCSAKQQQKPL